MLPARQPEPAAPGVRSDARGRTSLWLWCAALLTLPWIGCDLIVLVSGRDAGAGLQPSWLLLAAAWLVAGMGRPREDLPRAWRWLVGTVAGAVAVSALGLVVAPAGVESPAPLLRYLKQVAQLVIMTAFAIWPLVHLHGQEAWRRTARWLVVGALLQAGYGLLQWASYPEPGRVMAALERVFTSNPSILSGSESLYVDDRFVRIARLRGTACEPLYLGNYLLLALPMVALTGWAPRARALAGTALAALLLMTWSRGAWIGAWAGLLTAGWWLAARRADGGRGGRRLLPWGIALVAAVALAAAAGWEPARLPWRRLTQTFSPHDWSNLTRLYSYQAAWRAFLLSPLVGIGWGQFGWHFPTLVDPAGLQAMFTWPVVANFPLLVLCETGVLGLATLGWGVGGLLRGIVRCRRRAAEACFAVDAVGVLATACVALAVQTMTFSQYNLPHAWVALGLLGAALLRARGREMS